MSQHPDGLECLLSSQDSVVSVRQALQYLSPAALQHRLDRGRWQQPYRGVLVTHSGPLTSAQWTWAGLLSVREPAFLAGITAATHCGLRGYGRQVVHVLVPASRKTGDTRTRSQTPSESWPVIVHRSVVLGDEDVMWSGMPPRTTVARSLVDAAQWAQDNRTALAIVTAGIQQRLATPADLLEVLGRLTRARRRELILGAVKDAAGGAESLAEIDFIRLCRRYRLPLPDQQVRRTDSAGRRRYLDAYWRQWRLHVEIDGAHHTDVRNWWDDMQRQNQLWVAGDRILRFPAWVVRQRPAEVVAQIVAALRAQGWRP